MDNSKKTIFLGGDTLGYDLKADLRDFLRSKGYKTVDLGMFKDDDIGFEDIIREVGEKVGENKGSLGLAVFGKTPGK